MGGPTLVGHWRDRTAEAEADRQAQRRADRAQASGRTAPHHKRTSVWIPYPIDLVPLPQRNTLRPGQRRTRVADIVRLDDQKTRERHARDGTEPLGARAIRATATSSSSC